MHSERVTVTLPAEVRAAAQQAADASGMPLSALVSKAVQSYVRGRLVDAWLSEFQSEHGAFSEAELAELAAEAGVPYVPATARDAA